MNDFPISRKEQFKLTLLSSIYFIISTLVVRGLINLIVAFLLVRNNVSFQYNLLGHSFQSQGGKMWTEEKTILIYFLGPVLIFTMGLLLFKFLRSDVILHWKKRLFLSWMSFIMVHQLVFSFIAGCWIFADLGFAIITFIPVLAVRITLSLLLVVIAVFWRPEWVNVFLTTSYTRKVFMEIHFMRHFIMLVLVLPWMIGFSFLSLWIYWHNLTPWLITILAMGLVTTPVLNRVFPIKMSKIKIVKTDKVIFKKPTSILKPVLVIVIIMALSTIYVQI